MSSFPDQEQQQPNPVQQIHTSSAPPPPVPNAAWNMPPPPPTSTTNLPNAIPDNNNNGDDDQNAQSQSIHWGSPTNPLTNDRYIRQDYNALQPTLSNELWTATTYPPAPPMGVPYEFPAPPPGAQPPRMGFYAGDPNQAILGRPVDYDQLPPPQQQVYNQNLNNINYDNNENNNAQEMVVANENGNTTDNANFTQRIPNPTGGWAEPRDPQWGCNAREICSIVFGLLFQACVQLHLIFLIICMGFPYGAGDNIICRDYFWLHNPQDGTVHGAWIGVICSTGFFYLLESVFNPFREYVWNLRTRVESYQFLSKLADTRPNLWFHIQCYHYETRTYTDSKGRTRTRQVRVNTHSATGHYNFTSWRNVGAPPLLSAVKALRVRLDKEFTFADQETKDGYDSSFALFVAMNDRDTHKDVSSGFDLEDWEDYFLSMIRDKEDETSFQWFCYRHWWYWLCVLFLFSGFFRALIAVGTNSLSYTFVKEVKK